MVEWLRTCMLLCLCGFFKSMRPAEPFMTHYLVGPPMNLTHEEVYYQVYPVWTYSYLSLLVVVFLLTDFLRYKPVIVAEAISFMVTWSLLLWGRGVSAMQAMQFMFGAATASEVAYYTYVYAKVPSKFYQQVTSYTRAAHYAGWFFRGALSQVLTSTGLMNYHTLNYLSLATASVAFLFACVLPSVPTSVYFHRQQCIPDKEGNRTMQLNPLHQQQQSGGGGGGGGRMDKLQKVLRAMWSDFCAAYTNKYVLKWSLWWAFATCGNFIVGSYIQPLWETVRPVGGEEELYNGAVEATQTLLSALAVFGVGYLHLNWELLGEGTLALISLIDGMLLVMMGLSYNILVSYINYIIFRVSYHVLITIASYQVAKNLREDSYGLVFGINMFMSLLLQLILVVVVVQVLQLQPHTQFIIYGVYFLLLALVFLGLSAYSLSRMGCEGIQKAGIRECQPPSHANSGHC